jgi:hypothetical protein
VFIEQAHETARLNQLLQQLEQQKVDRWLGPVNRSPVLPKAPKSAEKQQ